MWFTLIVVAIQLWLTYMSKKNSPKIYSIVLVAAASCSSEDILRKLLKAVFSAMLLLIGVDEIRTIRNPDRLKRDLRVRSWNVIWHCIMKKLLYLSLLMGTWTKNWILIIYFLSITLREMAGSHMFGKSFQEEILK